jgi:hypothetical protein
LAYKARPFPKTNRRRRRSRSRRRMRRKLCKVFLSDFSFSYSLHLFTYFSEFVFKLKQSSTETLPCGLRILCLVYI